MVNTSIAERQPWTAPTTGSAATGSAAGVLEADRRVAAARTLRRIREGLGDVVLVLIIAYALPVAVLAVGTPIALFVRAVAAVVERLF
jgi:hypothetical protein